jgi:hypothetical protein
MARLIFLSGNTNQASKRAEVKMTMKKLHEDVNKDLEE